jgi:4'-phosphopantetheinyl transferase EntD
MNDIRVRNALRELFGPQVGIGVTDPRSDGYRLMAQEETAVARAVPKRKREFAAGRQAARMALEEIGFPQTAIPQARDRSPVWPAGITGSISHCNSICVSVACHIKTWRSIGVDVEGKTPLQKEAWPIILTPRELKALSKQPLWRRARRLRTLFSIKEAVYKAQYPLTGEICDFQSVCVTLDGNTFVAELQHQIGSFQAGYRAHGKFVELDRMVLSACMLEDR